MRLTVIIPTLNEGDQLPHALDHVLTQEPRPEVLVADGGSTDGTLLLVRSPAMLLRCPTGRAAQMNLAAQRATGDALLFLHADCHLPEGAAARVTTALADCRVVGGAFLKAFRSERWLLRGAVRRSRWWFRLGCFFGDQAMFVRRTTFEALGGFRTDVVAEDLDLARRMRQHGRVVLLPDVVRASARRLEQRGILRTWWTWWRIAVRQLAGRAPAAGMTYHGTNRDERNPKTLSSEPRSRPGSS